MSLINKIIFLSLLSSTIFIFDINIPNLSFSEGINVDAGTTAPLGRLVIRTQVRYLDKVENKNGTIKNDRTYHFPLILAYGLLPSITLLMKQTYIIKQIKYNQTSIDSIDKLERKGFGDLFFLVKFKLFRLNMRNFTFGVSPIIGVEFPTGNDEITSNIYNIKTGLFFTNRIKHLIFELNVIYSWKYLKNDKLEDNFDPGDDLEISTVGVYQISISKSGFFSIAPVFEIAYKKIFKNKFDSITDQRSGETVITAGPGIKFTIPFGVFETLITFPIWQNQNGNQAKHNYFLISGIRILL